MARYEKRCGKVCGKMPKLPTSKDRASKTNWITTTLTIGRMEMGSHHYGLCYGIIEDFLRKGLHMGDCGQIDKKCTLFSY